MAFGHYLKDASPVNPTVVITDAGGREVARLPAARSPGSIRSSGRCARADAGAAYRDPERQRGRSARATRVIHRDAGDRRQDADLKVRVTKTQGWSLGTPQIIR